MKQHILIYFTCSLALLVSRNNYTQKSWSSPIDLSQAGQSAVNPAVAMDPDGNIMVVWSRFDSISGYDLIQFRYYTASSNTWSPASNISADHDANYPQIAMDPVGNAMVIWSADNGFNAIVQARYYTASTGTWSSVYDLATTNLLTTVIPKIAIDAASNAMAVWPKYDIGNDCERVQARHYNFSTGIWDSANYLSSITDQVFHANVAMDPAGNAMATWKRPNDIEVRYYPTPTGPWDPVDNLSSGLMTAYEPHIAMDNAGNAIAVWNIYDGDTWRIQCRYYTAPAGPWDPPIYLSAIGKIAAEPYLTMDSDGNTSIVWRIHDVSDYYIIQTRYYTASTQTWSPAHDLSATGQNAYYPHVAMNASDQTFVWRRADDITEDVVIQARSYTTSTSTWSSVDNLSETGQDASNPQVAMDSNGNAAAVWQRSDGSNYIIQGSIFSEHFFPSNVLLPLAYFNVMNCWFWPSLWPHPELKKHFYLR